MKKQKLSLYLVPAALMCVPTAPVYARSFDEPSLTAIKAFSAAPVNDDALATATGGFKDARGNFAMLVRDTLDQNLLLQGEIGRVMMDNWFAADGAELLAASPATGAL